MLQSASQSARKVAGDLSRQTVRCFCIYRPLSALQIPQSPKSPSHQGTTSPDALKIGQLVQYALSSTDANKTEAVKEVLIKRSIDGQAFAAWCRAIECTSFRSTLSAMKEQDRWPEFLLLQLVNRVRRLHEVDTALRLFQDHCALMHKRSRRLFVLRLLRRCVDFRFMSELPRIIDLALDDESMHGRKVLESPEEKGKSIRVLCNLLLQQLIRFITPTSRQLAQRVLQVLSDAQHKNPGPLNQQTYVYLLTPNLFPEDIRQNVQREMVAAWGPMDSKVYTRLIAAASSQQSFTAMVGLLREMKKEGYNMTSKMKHLVRSTDIDEDRSDFREQQLARTKLYAMLPELHDGFERLLADMREDRFVNPKNATHQWYQLRSQGMIPDGDAVASFLRALILLAGNNTFQILESVEHIWKDMREDKVQPHLSTYAAFLQVLVACRRFDQAFEMMVTSDKAVEDAYEQFHPDITCVNILMEGLNRYGNGASRLALGLWWNLDRWRLEPDSATFRIAIRTAEYAEKEDFYGEANTAWQDGAQEEQVDIAPIMQRQLGIRIDNDKGMSAKVGSLFVRDYEESAALVGKRIWHHVVHGEELGPMPWPQNPQQKRGILSTLRGALRKEQKDDTDADPLVTLDERHFQAYIHLVGSHGRGDEIPSIVQDMFDMGIVPSKATTLTPAMFYVGEALSNETVDDNLLGRRRRKLERDVDEMVERIMSTLGREAVPSQEDLERFWGIKMRLRRWHPTIGG